MELNKSRLRCPKTPYRELKPGEERTSRDARPSNPLEGGDAFIPSSRHRHGYRLRPPPHLSLKVAAAPRPPSRSPLIAGHGIGTFRKKNMLGQARLNTSSSRLSVRDRRRSDFHLFRALSILGSTPPSAGVPSVVVRRFAGHRKALIPLPQILPSRRCIITISFPKLRRPPKSSSRAIAGNQAKLLPSRDSWAIVRLRGRHVRWICGDRVGLDTHLRMGQRRRRQVQGSLRLNTGRRAGPGIHHRPEIRHDHRLAARVSCGSSYCVDGRLGGI